MNETASKLPALSAPMPATRAVASPGEFLSFHLGAEEYGIDILKVQEIRGYEAATRLANAPAYILGVLNLRGVIVPILDMRIKFGMDSVAYNAQTVTIVLNVAQRVVGMVVDSVSDVVALSADEIRPAPEFTRAIAVEHITGLGTLRQGDAERMLVLMDIEQLMSSATMGLVTPGLQ